MMHGDLQARTMAAALHEELRVTREELRGAKKEAREARRKLGIAKANAEATEEEIHDMRHELVEVRRELKEAKDALARHGGTPTVGIGREAERDATAVQLYSARATIEDLSTRLAEAETREVHVREMLESDVARLEEEALRRDSHLVESRGTIASLEEKVRQLKSELAQTQRDAAELKTKVEAMGSEVKRLQVEDNRRMAVVKCLEKCPAISGPVLPATPYASRGVLRLNSGMMSPSGRKKAYGAVGRQLPRPPGVAASVEVKSCLVDRDPEGTGAFRVVIVFSESRLALYRVRNDSVTFVGMTKLSLSSYPPSCLSPSDFGSAYCVLDHFYTARNFERHKRSLVRVDIPNGVTEKMEGLKVDFCLAVHGNGGFLLAVEHSQVEGQNCKWWRIRHGESPRCIGEYNTYRFFPIGVEDEGRYCVVSKLPYDNSPIQFAFCKWERGTYVEKITRDTDESVLEAFFVPTPFEREGVVRFVLTSTEKVVVFEYGSEGLTELRRIPVSHGSLKGAQVSIPSVVNANSPLWLLTPEKTGVVIRDILGQDPIAKASLTHEEIGERACSGVVVDSSYSVMVTNYRNGRVVVWGQGM